VDGPFEDLNREILAAQSGDNSRFRLILITVFGVAALALLGWLAYAIIRLAHH
jgi:hypothetical protein